MKSAIQKKSHFCLTVSNIDNSKQWYNNVLGRIGFISIFEDETQKYYGSKNFPFYIGIYEASRSKTKCDRRNVGFHHLGIAVPKKEIVDDMYSFLTKLKVKIEAPPKHYPDYEDELYYALFFYDPDGMRIEVFHEIN